MNFHSKYYDSAATTPVDKRVLDAMLPYFSELFGNASSLHNYGKKANEAIENARKEIADLINANTEEIFFTSGATEAINWAIKGFTEENYEKGNHIITVKTEHKAVINTCEYLETKGFEVTYLDVDQNGLISLSDLIFAIKPTTILISVMYVNNETGIIQDIKTIGEIATERKIAFFCDATQAVGKIPIDVKDENIDMLSLSGHKFNGPKGVGALYIKKGIKINSLIHGGGQEKGLRGGTYNTPLIVGLGKASNISFIEMNERLKLLLLKRAEMEDFITTQKIGIINFLETKRAPHIISVSLMNNKNANDFLIENSNLFVASTGSACSSGLIQDSHVYKALKLKNIKSIVRFSIL